MELSFKNLYEAILQNPKDDLPRLIFADALVEYTYEPRFHYRSEFIREQIWGLTPATTIYDFKEFVCPDGYTLLPNKIPFGFSRGFISRIDYGYDTTFSHVIGSASSYQQLYPISEITMKHPKPVKFGSGYSWIRCERHTKLKMTSPHHLPKEIFQKICKLSTGSTDGGGKLEQTADSWRLTFGDESEAKRALFDTLYNMSRENLQ